jgi:glutamate racemase
LSASAPIGIFDSGVGGLTVANAISKYLPKERLIYFGDTAHLPYGDKAPAHIIEYSKAISQFLIDKGCKMVVIACNTASSIAYQHVKEMAGDIPVINVIDPVVEVVVNEKKARKVGVIGTRATINSGEYEKRIKKLNARINVFSMATPLLVPLIEEHIMDDQIGKLVISKYLSQPVLSDIDSLILGCTHYPLVKESVAHFYRGEVDVIDSADIVGKYVSDYLNDHNLQCTEKPTLDHDFYVSDFTESFEKNTRSFFGHEIHLKQIDFW